MDHVSGEPRPTSNLLQGQTRVVDPGLVHELETAVDRCGPDQGREAVDDEPTVVLGHGPLGTVSMGADHHRVPLGTKPVLPCTGPTHLCSRVLLSARRVRG